MSIHKLAQENGLKTKYTSRLFWGEFGYSLRMPIPSGIIDDHRQRISDFWDKVKFSSYNNVNPNARLIHSEYKDEINNLIKTVIGKNKDLFEAECYSYQTTTVNIIFYVKQEWVAALLIKNNPTLFDECSAPMNKKVEDHLQTIANKKIIVRDEGWYGQYSYQVRLKWMFDYTQEDQRVKSLIFNDLYYSEGDTRILYLNDEDDLFLAKLALSDVIHEVTQCVLVKDL